jgi:hypothetical protein
MPTKANTNEKWILTVKELHFGHCKETFRAGAVIELDEDNGRLIIDGRRFNDTRDLDVLKGQSNRCPDNPWVVPYTPQNRIEILQGIQPPMVSQQKQLRPDQQMQVIQSDQDLSEEIDIRATQISKVAAAKKVGEKQYVKDHGMEIIRGDESVEDRIASLRGKNDIGSIAERTRLKASGSTRMQIVKDDSLGAGFTGKNSVSMNAGQHLPSREEADAKKESAIASANARKKEADQTRREAGIEDDVPTAQVVGDEQETVPSNSVSEENVILRAQNQAMQSQMDRMEKMMASIASSNQPKATKIPKVATVTGLKRGRPPKAAVSSENVSVVTTETDSKQGE